MHSKAEKRKVKKYSTAPPKSSVSYFLTSFILTLVLCFSAAGFVIANRNSQKMGWGNNIQVFSVISGTEQVGFTFMDNSYTVDSAIIRDTKNTVDNVLNKVRVGYGFLEPEPLQLARIIYNWCYLRVTDLLSSIIPESILPK